MNKFPLLTKLWKKFNPLFWLLVILPTSCSVLYFTFWASDIYISETNFVVRTPQNQASLTGVGSLLQNVGFSRSQDDTYTVLAFLRSREALTQVSNILPVRQYYSDKGDFFRRFNPLGLKPEDEAFYQYFQDYLSVNVDSVSGIASLRVRAFEANEAEEISLNLLKQAEMLINRLNERARKDTIMFSEQAVKKAEQDVMDSAQSLSQYRIKNGIFDVTAESEILLSSISRLQDELINIQTQLQQIQALSPQNPQINTLKVREKSIKTEIEKQINLVLGGGHSIATQTAEYQRLVLTNTLAQQQLTTAITALQNAISEADRKQLYLEVITPPSKPDLALEPHRLYNILATFFFGLLLYGIVRLLVASIREHRN